MRKAFGCARIIGIAAVGAGVILTVPSHANANSRYAGFVIDANNGNVLYEDRADEYRYPASLTKMMTLYLTFDALSKKRIALTDKMPVSRYAAGRPPTKVGVPAGGNILVEEAIYALVTKSANDASVVLGEYLGGSEAEFAEMMTRTARKLGMSKTTYKNPNGLPDSGQRTTARDQAKLGIALREHFPQYYKYFSTRSYNFRGTRLGNHNRVLGRMDGVDGIKTGYINASGFNLVTSIKRDGKSVVAVVMGGRSGRSRDDHMIELLKRTMPMASRRDEGALIAARPNTDAGLVAVAVGSLPAAGPVPNVRPALLMTADERIAMAYEDSGSAGLSSLPQPSSRPIRGRQALAAALLGETPQVPLMLPAASANALAAPVPGNRNIDPTFTGAIGSRQAMPATANSAWVVQIAATPDAALAQTMLEDAKRKAGADLAAARPFTEPVTKGSTTLHRARFAGFDTKDEAWRACAALKRVDYACYAVAH
ncbi:D-alanyl-D-alanine carboxypeptidase [Fulvimarina sp. 2208YS6-2-32]|uniref:D-alanyl-D-alanine carboxypeptidase n=1 Tax=Fulvimarina uroteuthidis TaxID=3098149 RepID=A0ABU5I3S1_9HYPH|nr:D-alanyl-D-alanine carboxypeptidase [Fulvimarina sp. 2208YS6-2-32]MDY8109856.1 D-alanyl-D-alanine carboxypeptidase [Fulvimarina sp. 2208YS6-2-32]